MSWHGLHLSTAAKLSLHRHALRVERPNVEPVRVALEDLAWIILDTQEVTLTAALLSACMTAGVPIVSCDQRHMPAGVALPFHQHFAQAEIAQLQLSATDGLKRKLWATLIRAKIKNQAATLARAHLTGAEAVRNMAERVTAGDPNNIEARAARAYWSALFSVFRRDVDGKDRRNAMLNYGYAVLRAGLARGLVAAGLLPAVGVHHRGKLNAFNLADDLIEPYRPLVDWRVRARDAEASTATELTLEDRQHMAGILLAGLNIEGQKMTVLAAIEKTVASLVRAFRTRDSKALELPAAA